MKRALLVDDDPRVLEGLRDALRPLRREWTVRCAGGAEAALSALEAESFDVVMSDLRLPGMDGAALLELVRTRQPHALRIVLSGSADEALVCRAAGVAHRFLAKPCEFDALAAVLTRARRGSAAASAAGALPCAPALYVELTALLGRPGAGMPEVARLVARDVAVAAKVLQLTNSAFFGLPRTVTRLDEAVAYLGLTTLQAVVLSAGVLTAFAPAPPIPGFSIEAHQQHGMRVAELARAAGGEAAFAAGLLHDIGWLVLAVADPERVAALLAAGDVAVHPEIGAQLLELWGLPDPIVAAVASHHGSGDLEGPAAAVRQAVAQAAS